MSALFLVLLLALVLADFFPALQIAKDPEGTRDDLLSALQAIEHLDIEVPQKAGLDRHELGLPLGIKQPDAFLVPGCAGLKHFSGFGLDLAGYQGLDGD